MQLNQTAIHVGRKSSFETESKKLNGTPEAFAFTAILWINIAKNLLYMESAARVRR